MPAPVWLWPAAKAAGVWIVTNGPGLVEMGKKYIPPVYRGYKHHGLKPVRIISYASKELSGSQALLQDGSKAKPGKDKQSTAKRQRSGT